MKAGLSPSLTPTRFRSGENPGRPEELGLPPGASTDPRRERRLELHPTMWASLAGGMVAAPIKPTLWNSAGEGEFHERLAGLVQALEDPIVVCADERLFRCGTCRLSSYELLRSSAESEEFEPVQSEGRQRSF